MGIRVTTLVSFLFASRVAVDAQNSTHNTCELAQLAKGFPFVTTDSPLESGTLFWPDSMDACPIYTNLLTGKWYSVTGNGRCITVQVDGVDKLDPIVAVYGGGCRSLTCVGIGDDSSYWDTDSTLSWTAQAGVEYLVTVDGYFDNGGSFQVTLTEGAGPCLTDPVTSVCSFCPDGSDFDQNAEDPIDCVAYEEDEVSLLPSSAATCPFHQMIGSHFCGCPATTVGSCRLCPDGSIPPELNRSLPFLGLTCEDVLVTPAIDDSCSHIQGLSGLCGCPNVPMCNLCGDAGMPDPDKVIDLGGNSLTCAGIEREIHYGFMADPVTGCDVVASDQFFRRLYPGSVIQDCCPVGYSPIMTRTMSSGAHRPVSWLWQRGVGSVLFFLSCGSLWLW